MGLWSPPAGPRGPAHRPTAVRVPGDGAGVDALGPCEPSRRTLLPAGRRLSITAARHVACSTSLDSPGGILTITGVITALVIGAVIGALARLILPGRQNIPVWL